MTHWWEMWWFIGWRCEWAHWLDMWVGLLVGDVVFIGWRYKIIGWRCVGSLVRNVMAHSFQM